MCTGTWSVFLWNGTWLSTYPRYVTTPHINADSTVMHFRNETKSGLRDVKVQCFGHTKPIYYWKQLWFLLFVSCCCCFVVVLFIFGPQNHDFSSLHHFKTFTKDCLFQYKEQSSNRKRTLNIGLLKKNTSFVGLQ